MSASLLPFSAFLSELRNEQFTIGVDSYLRLASLLERCDGSIDPSRLKTTLCPLFATSPEEQRRLYQLFDRYYGVIEHEPTRSADPSKSDVLGEDPHSRYWTWVAMPAVILATLFAFMTYWYVHNRNTPLPPPTPSETPTSTTKKSPTPQPTPKQPRPTSAPTLTQSVTEATDWRRLTLLAPAVLLILYTLLYWGRRGAGAYLLRQGRPSQPGFLWKNVVARLPIVKAPELLQNIRRLRRRIVSPSTQLDIERSVRTTIARAGFPQLYFRSSSRRPEYLVLIDRASIRDHQAALLDHLVKRVSKDGQIAIDEYFFAVDPRVCIGAKSGTAVYLADLLPRMIDHRLLIFGDGAALQNSFTGERAPWADIILDRPQTALLTPKMENWGAREEALSQWTVLCPATLQGLTKALDAFEERSRRSAAPDAGKKSPEYPAVESRERVRRYVDELREYLGETNLQWLAACALYPKLEWALTLHLGAILDGTLVDHENVLKIAALPWFRQGYYPLSLQQALFEQLEPDKRRFFGEKIIALIERGVSGSNGDLSLEIIVQRFGLSPAERHHLTEDEPLSRLAMTAGRSKLALRIPERLRRALFKFGVPAFGLRAWPLTLLACLTIAGIVAAEMVPRYQKPVSSRSRVKAMVSATIYSDTVSSLAFSPDGRTLATATTNGTVNLWDVATRKEQATLSGHSGYVELSFSPDGRTLATGSADKTVKLWDMATGKAFATLTSGSYFFRSVAFSPDGKTLAASTINGTVNLWDTTTLKELAILTGLGEAGGIAFSPDGKTFAAGTAYGPVKIWDTATLKELAPLTGHSDIVFAVAFSPDGKTLATGSSDKTVKLWDLATSKELATLTGHSSTVFSVAFSPDGGTLATGSADKTVRLWDTSARMEIATLTGHSDSVSSVAFSPDGKTLATGSYDKTVKLWEISSSLEGYQSGPNVSQQALKPACTNPSFPEPAPTTNLGIDDQCGNEGNGGKEAEQNSVKNSFCPTSETPEEITFATLQQLQASVEKNSSINFGSSGPTTDRSPLKTLGEGKLVTLKAFVLKARQEGGESVNCKGTVPDDPLFHDIHIAFVDAANKPQSGDTKAVSDKKECTGIVAEMSPHHRPDVWTADNVNKVATAQALVRITGQQFFDSSHVPCSNGAPVGSNPKRVSLWEIHPIYEFEVCIADCAGAGQWQPLDQWLTQH